MQNFELVPRTSHHESTNTQSIGGDRVVLLPFPIPGGHGFPARPAGMMNGLMLVPFQAPGFNHYGQMQGPGPFQPGVINFPQYMPSPQDVMYQQQQQGQYSMQMLVQALTISLLTVLIF